jgi:hypothetical protein
MRNGNTIKIPEMQIPGSAFHEPQKPGGFEFRPFRCGICLRVGRVSFICGCINSSTAATFHQRRQSSLKTLFRELGWLWHGWAALRSTPFAKYRIEAARCEQTIEERLLGGLGRRGQSMSSI